MKVTQKNNLIIISFQYNPYLVSKVKTLDNRKYSPKERAWYIPIANSTKSIEKLTKWGFEVETDLLKAVKEDHRKAKEAEALAVMPDTEFETPLPLFPYQKVGASFLYKIGSGLLGDEMGLGKTVMALALAEKVKAQKVLIFCPAAIKYQWSEEIRKFLNEGAVVINGTKIQRILQWRGGGNPVYDKETRKPIRFYISNYELLLRDFDFMSITNWDIIIADEATRISNPQAKQSKQIKKLRAKRKIAMTGTPISNRAHEVWNIIDFTNPGVFGSYYAFTERYCTKNPWGGISGHINTDELRDKLCRYMIRRTKKEVLPELPDRISTDVPFKMSEEEMKFYNRIKKELLFELKEGDISKIKNPMTIQYTLTKMLRLRQIADSLELVGENIVSSKLNVLKELLVDALANGKKAIIFTGFAEMADILERELTEYSPLKISGKIKEEYQDVVKRFNDIEKHRILISTSAGQFGLNIQRASVVFHYDIEWSLSKMEQRVGRVHRIGQKKVVQEFTLLAKGTVDYYVKKIVHEKAELAEKILGDPKITGDDIMQMLI